MLRKIVDDCQAMAAICVIASLAGSAAALGAEPEPGARQSQTLRLDATAPPPGAGPADYQTGASRAPDGSTIGVTDRYLTRNGQPWLPVMGEMHFSRVPEAEWEDTILRMQSAGVQIISTYIIWIHHEEVEGQWDWAGGKDLRRFAQLCQKHGMLLYPRLGPWAHGEARNGGLPDWVVARGSTRQTDPKFMAATKTLYDQIGAQLRGLLWKDGGPVIGVQIENEYSARGAGKGAEYLLALKKLAIASGFDVPLYTLTGWDYAVVPPHEFLPVYGGYPEAPWGSSRSVLPPPEVYAFRFASRVSGSMGTIGAAASAAQPAAKEQRLPFLTAEMGGGTQDTYHRRPQVDADDITAMLPVMIGSGVNLYGTYMFAGGQNPVGRLSSLQESQATQYPTDVPEKSYDFQALIGEYGLERLSLRRLKSWNYWLNDFGSLLAPMPAYAPERAPTGPTDLDALRWSVRTDGKAGFLFANNYVRGAAMPAHPQTQFELALAGGRRLTLPATPIDIPSGAYFAWPFGLDLDGVPLRYATAQLMARLEGAEGTTFVLACVRGVRCELALEGSGFNVQARSGVRVEHRDGATILTRTDAEAARTSTPHFDQAVQLSAGGGKSVRVLLLSADAADNTWKVTLGGEQQLLQTSADLFADRASVTLRQLEDPALRFAVYPASASAPGSSVPVSAAAGGGYVAQLPRFAGWVTVTQQRPAGQAPPVGLGPAFSYRPERVAQAPSDATWSEDAARWSLRIAPPEMPGQGQSVSNLFLTVDYQGDVARLTSAGRLLDDDFFNGELWQIGLGRYAAKATLPPLEIAILPIRSDAPVYLPAKATAKLAATGQTVELNSVTLLPQYQLKLTAAPAKP